MKKGAYVAFSSIKIDKTTDIPQKAMISEITDTLKYKIMKMDVHQQLEYFRGVQRIYTTRCRRYYV
jgi:hypothetical protein